MKFKAQSSIIINADLTKIHECIADFATWQKWSPWSVAEPEHEGSTTGKAGTIGHQMSWDGEIIGAGTNTIAAIDANTIIYDLLFTKPHKSKAISKFVLSKVKNGTKVTWTMDSSLPFFMFWMLKSMKAWIEMDFDRGLLMLKTLLEDGSINVTTKNKGVVDFTGFSYFGISKNTHLDVIPSNMSDAFSKIMKTLAEAKKQARHWVALYPKFNSVKKTMTYVAAASDEELENHELGSEFVRGQVKSGKMLQITHTGSYKFLGNAWSMGMMYLRAHKLKQNGVPFEYYHNNPGDTEESKLETSIYFPIKR